MTLWTTFWAATLVASALANAQGAAGPAEVFWPAWRGPAANGTGPSARPPLRWSETNNLRWKAEIPGKGHATPVVWGDRLFVTTAVPSATPVTPDKVQAASKDIPDFSRRNARLPDRELEFTVLALRRTDGRLLWKRRVCTEAPATGTHGDGSWASGSPLTDGQRVYAFFGSHGLYCLDLEGHLKWERRFGTMKIKASFGEGSSPVLCGAVLVLNWDHEGDSFITALDKHTGTELWRTPRDEKTSWSTPLVVTHGGRTQVVVSATGRIRAYDPADGKVIWECAGMTGNVIPCPVYDGTHVICMSGFRGSALLAIRLDAAAGDLSDTPGAIAWRRNRDTPYVPSPLLHDGLLYFLKVNEAVLTCVETAGGRPCYEARTLEGLKQVYASPVAAGGRIYVTGRNGVTVVLAPGPEFRVLATNALEESFSASAAVAEGDLYLRGQKFLYCIAEPRSGS